MFRYVMLILAVCLLFAGVAIAQDRSDTEGRQKLVDAYVAEYVPDWADSEALNKAIWDGGENWQELADALTYFAVPTKDADEAQNNAYGCMCWLLINAPHLDRLELTTDMLVENMELALADAGSYGYDTTSDFFRRNVLNYRLDDEPVTAWRDELAVRYTPPMSAGYEPGLENHLGLAEKIVNFVTAGFTVLKRGYFGNLGDPVSIDNARAGTERELAMLTAAALRSQGFATRYVKENRSGKSWVEVYIGDAADYDASNWVPVYPTAPDMTGDSSYAMELCDGFISVVTAGDAFGMEQVTGRYTDVCAVQPVFWKQGPDGLTDMGKYEHWSITAWDGSTYQPLDDLGYPVSEEDYPLTYGASVEDRDTGTYFIGAPGEYMLQAGVRYPGGIIHVVTEEFSAEPGGMLHFDIDLTPPADLPLEALIERSVPAEVPEQYGEVQFGTRLYLVVDGSEPSIRAEEALREFTNGSHPDVEYMVVDYATVDGFLAGLCRDALKVNDNDEKPVAVVLRDGETLLYQRGYNINILDYVLRALAGN